MLMPFLKMELYPRAHMILFPNHFRKLDMKPYFWEDGISVEVQNILINGKIKALKFEDEMKVYTDTQELWFEKKKSKTQILTN